MKLKSTVATETYLTAGGYYAIAQDDGQTCVVLLSPDQMKELIADMQEKLKSVPDWWPTKDNAEE